ncbi:hypothetical protein IFM47457_01313 [Aspergillus lentulus]|nr:hypothetical protein IFM47457_01313 [Aspergillus lentulus]
MAVTIARNGDWTGCAYKRQQIHRRRKDVTTSVSISAKGDGIPRGVDFFLPTGVHIQGKEGEENKKRAATYWIASSKEGSLECRRNVEDARLSEYLTRMTKQGQ